MTRAPIRDEVVERPCGGCGAKTDRERCMGCFHDFGTPESQWVRDYAARLALSRGEPS